MLSLSNMKFRDLRPNIVRPPKMFVAFVLGLMASGCATLTPEKVNLIESQGRSINSGESIGNIRSIFGEPDRIDSYQNMVTLKYCGTGKKYDPMLYILFTDGRVSDSTIEYNSRGGNCYRFFKMTDWSESRNTNRLSLKTEEQLKYANVSDSRLCTAWMSLHPLNIHKDDHEREIRRRGLNCNDYGDVGAAQRAAENKFQNALCKLGANCRTRSTTAPVPQVQPTPNKYLTGQSPIVGGSLCRYSDGSVVRIQGSYCPR